MISTRTVFMLFGTLWLGLFSSCKQAIEATSSQQVTAASCKGTYFERDRLGDLKKYNEFFNPSTKTCLTDEVPLTQWEKTNDFWEKNSVNCTPQPQFQPVSMLSSSNYYSYRDNRIYLDLDSTTGIYRKLTIAEDTNGNPVFTRLQGCFYERTGAGVDAIYGSQILLDTEITKLKTSEVFDPMEIFKYSVTNSDIEMIRFDATADWDYTFCPAMTTPWNFCTDLRNGNVVYYPTLTSIQMLQLTNEAILIRTQFKFTKISRIDFYSTWNNIEKTYSEVGRSNWKYMVSGVVDTPPYIDQAWRDYVMGKRPNMPTIN